MPYYRDTAVYRDSSYYRDSVPIQISVPTGDKYIDGWYTSPIYSKINEITPDTSNFVHTNSGDLGITFEVYLSGIKRPSAKYPGDTKISVQYRKSILNPDTPLYLHTQLLEGSTVIKDYRSEEIFETGWTILEIPLTFAERDRIRNWSGLSVLVENASPP